MEKQYLAVSDQSRLSYQPVGSWVFFTHASMLNLLETHLVVSKAPRDRWGSLCRCRSRQWPTKPPVINTQESVYPPGFAGNSRLDCGCLGTTFEAYTGLCHVVCCGGALVS